MAGTIKRIEIDGLRTLDKFALDFNGLTVLIGENGSGKSSVLEACELLRRLTTPKFSQEYTSIHGGDAMLQRNSGTPIRLGVEVDCGNGKGATYSVAFTNRAIEEEVLTDSEKTRLIERCGKKIEVKSKAGQAIKSGGWSAQVPLIARHGWSHPDPEVACVAEALENIEVHLPFETLAYWAAKSQGNRASSATRDSVTVAPATRLERFRQNLPNAFFALKNESSRHDWDYTMDLVRLGLGNWVDAVNTRADAGGGKIALWLKARNSDLQIPALSLSDGQLAYLGFVALTRLSSNRSLLCFDEPELHLHPRLLTRVVSLLEETAQRQPVVVATHSRRLLDELANPAETVAVCELDPDKLQTSLSRLDPDKLATWLESYDGLGRVLDAGYEASLFTSGEEAGAST